MGELNAYSLALLLNEGSFSCVKAANTLGFVSHDHLTRELSKEFMPSPVADWNHVPRQGILVIDDTLIAKPHSKAIEGVKWQFDSSKGKALPGINLLLAVWTAGEVTYILDVILPNENNRNDLVQQLLKRMKDEDFEPNEVLFDSWYAASKTLNLIHSLGWTYVSRIRSNRLFNKEPVDSHAFYGAQGITGKLKGVYQQVQIVKDGDRYLLTNELTPHTSRSLSERYKGRWVVETVFRDLKSILHLEKCSCRNLDAQFNHVLCVLEAWLHLRKTFPALSVGAAQQEYLKLNRCPNCRPDLTQFVRA